MHRVLHITDTHFTAPGSVSEHPEIDTAARLEAVLDAVAAEDFAPDLIVHTGDVADDGSAHAVRAVRERLATLGPVVAVPGNHDDPAVVRGVFGRPDARVGPWRVVGVDTVIPGHVEGRCDELADAVAALDGPTLVLMHHPIRSHSAHHWFRLEHGPAAETDLAATGQPVVVLSGHTHEVYDASLAGGRVRLLGGPGVFYALRHRGREWTFMPTGTGAQLVELADDGGVTVQRVYA